LNSGLCTRQGFALGCLSHTSSPLCSGYFEISSFFCPRPAWPYPPILCFPLNWDDKGAPPCPGFFLLRWDLEISSAQAGLEL
jgi:hypothetical protein